MSEADFVAAAMGMRSKLYHVAIAILWNEQDAADAVQEAMLKAWRRRGALRDEGQFEAWFTRILVNQCRDTQRRLVRRRRLLQDAGRQMQLEGTPPPRAELLEALRQLPQDYRLPVLLYYFDGYSQKEVARILGLTDEQVKGRVRRGREKLRRFLEDDDRQRQGGEGHA